MGSAEPRIRVLSQSINHINYNIIAPGWDAATHYVELLNARTGEQPQIASQSIIFANRTGLGDLLFSVDVSAEIPSLAPTNAPPPTPAATQTKKVNAGAIAGAVIGVPGGLALFICAFLVCLKKQRQTQQQTQQRAPRKDGITFDKYKPTAASTAEKKTKEVRVDV